MRAGDPIIERVVALDGSRIGEKESAGGEREGALDGRALKRAAGTEQDVTADLMRECAALDVGGANLHNHDVALARGEDAVPLGGEAAHLGAVVEDDKAIGIVIDERIRAIDRDIEERIDDLIGAADPLSLGLGAGREEQEEEDEGQYVDFELQGKGMINRLIV